MFQPHVGVADGVAVFALLGGSEHCLGFEQRQVAVQHIVGGWLVGLGHLLGHLADAPLGRHVEVTGVSLQSAGDE